MGFKGKLRQFFGLTPKKKVPPKQEGSGTNSYRSIDRELEEEFASLSNNTGTTGAVNKFGFGVIDDTCLEGSEERATFAVDVFHDAENCAVRQSTNGSRLYDAVIKAVLAATGVDTANIDVDADCDVYWRFVLPMRDGRVFPTRTLKDLLTRGVIHINPGEKKGAVDVVIKDAMDRFRSEHFDDSLLKKQNRIAVLISGDRDFASNIRRLRQCGLRTVLIYKPSITAPSFIDQLPPAMALGTWEELIDESEMDASDISKFSQRLSFRFKKRSFIAPRSPLERHDSVGSEMDTATTPSEFETNIPDFKFQCAKDLYKFLLKSKNYSIDANDLSLFWDQHPTHRHEIGKISNFCQSAKAEGAFTWSHCKGSNVFCLKLNPPNMRKQSIANVLHMIQKNHSHPNRKKSVIHSNSGNSRNGVEKSEDEDWVFVFTVCKGILLISSFAAIIYILASVYISCLFLGIRVPL